MESVVRCLSLTNPKKFRLTPQGNALYDTFKQILTLYDQIARFRKCAMWSEPTNIRRKQHRVACASRLPEIIHQFPSVNAQVEYRRANLVYEDVLHGSADIGLVPFPTQQRTFHYSFANDERLWPLVPIIPSIKKYDQTQRLAGRWFVPLKRYSNEKQRIRY